MRAADRAEEQALLSYVSAYEPVRYSCIERCGRAVAAPASRCVICGNRRRRRRQQGARAPA